MKLRSNTHDCELTSEAMNPDLNRIKEWAFQWKMSFNPDPNKQAAEVIFLHKLKPPTHQAISFNNCQVAFVLSHKHLGMILDSKLNFDLHLTEKITKAN